MTISQQATDGLLKTIGWLHPEYSGLIGFLQQHEAQLEAAGPVIQAAATEGPGALAAAEKAAPDLAKAIKDFVAASPVASGGSPQVTAMHAENITRRIVGAPVLTPSQENDWLNSASGDSRTGSG
jgi:hypothetical protein